MIDCKTCKNEKDCRFKDEAPAHDHCNFYIGIKRHETSEAVVPLNGLLGCKDLAEAMRANKKKLVFFGVNNEVLELDVVKDCLQDDALLIYLKKAK